MLIAKILDPILDFEVNSMHLSKESQLGEDGDEMWTFPQFIFIKFILLSVWQLHIQRAP